MSAERALVRTALSGSELRRSIGLSSANLNKENSVVFCLFFQILHAVIPSIHTCLDWFVWSFIWKCAKCFKDGEFYGGNHFPLGLSVRWLVLMESVCVCVCVCRQKGSTPQAPSESLTGSWNTLDHTLLINIWQNKDWRGVWVSCSVCMEYKLTTYWILHSVHSVQITVL